MFRKLPVGATADGKQFYITGANNASALTDINGYFRTDTAGIQDDNLYKYKNGAGPIAEQELRVRTNQEIDAQYFKGYSKTMAPVFVRALLPDGQYVTVKNATVDVLGRFLTSAVRVAYNYGNTRYEQDINNISTGKLMNENFGSNGPLNLVLPEGTLSPFLFSNYANLAIKSVTIGKDTISEDDVLCQIEWSRMKLGPIDCTVNGGKVNIRWTQLRYNLVYDNRLYKVPGQKDVYLDYLNWLSKDVFDLKGNNAILPLKEEICIVYILETMGALFNYGGQGQPLPWPKSVEYLSNELNIVPDYITDPNSQILNSFPFEFRNANSGPMRVQGGYVTGLSLIPDWYQH